MRAVFLENRPVSFSETVYLITSFYIWEKWIHIYIFDWIFDTIVLNTCKKCCEVLIRDVLAAKSLYISMSYIHELHTCNFSLQWIKFSVAGTHATCDEYKRARDK